jgi:hypothetical protein
MDGSGRLVFLLRWTTLSWYISLTADAQDVDSEGSDIVCDLSGSNHQYCTKPYNLTDEERGTWKTSIGEAWGVHMKATHSAEGSARELSGARKLAAPHYGVTDVAFDDTAIAPGALTGTVTWKNPTGVTIPPTTVVAVLLLRHPDELNDIVALPVPGNTNNGPYYAHDHPRGSWFVQLSPVAYTSLQISGAGMRPTIRRGSVEVQSEHRRRYSWGSANYLDRFICVVCVSIADGWALGPRSCIPVHDFSDEAPVLAAQSFSFRDSNSAAGLISGTFSFFVPDAADFTVSTHFRIDLATRAELPSILNGTLIADLPIQIDRSYSYTITDRPVHGNYLRLYNVNEVGVSHPLVIHLYDQSGLPPTAQVSAISLDGTYTVTDLKGGVVSWSEPADTSSYQQYYIYVAEDEHGAGSIQLGTADPPSTKFTVTQSTSIGTRSYILIRTHNDAPLNDGLGPIVSLHFQPPPQGQVR